MFTGLVEKTGIVKNIQKTSDGAVLSISVDGFDDLKIGDSISINGACQTVVGILGNFFSVQTINETLNITTLGNLKIGNSVNLERAIKADGRFGGHMVAGHIDGICKLSKISQNGISKILKFEFDTKYIIQKGSIALNGVSLTVSEVGENFFEVSLIPHSFENTNLCELKAGDFVNVEVDLIGKYVEKFLYQRNNEGKISENFLKECGF